MELIRQQMDKETFDYQQYGFFVIDIMSKLCAPARDTSIEQLRNATDPVTLFKYAHFFSFVSVYVFKTTCKDYFSLYRGIMEMLELLKLDMANYTIQQMRPYIQQQVVAYEQKKFQELLDTQKGRCKKKMNTFLDVTKTFVCQQNRFSFSFCQENRFKIPTF